MATGDQNDVLNRLTQYLPPWFGDVIPLLNAVLLGYAQANNFIYELYDYTKLQTRIKTATDDFLDFISQDFFGDNLPRRESENDHSFRTRILVNLFRARATRQAMSDVLEDLTGIPPIIFEPERDGAYLNTNFYLNLSAPGSGSYPYQAFITAFRPDPVGGLGVAGLNTEPLCLNIFSCALTGDSETQRVITDQDIYDAVEATRPAGTVMWLQIENAP